MHMTADTAAEPAAGEGFRHRALLYRGTVEYRAAVRGYLRRGLARAEPVLIAVPQRKVAWLRSELKAEPTEVAFADMTELGRNPARIIPALRAFMDRHAGQRVWCIAEPVWPGRSAAEMREAARHEALVNTAFAGASASFLCLYDRAALTQPVIADAVRTHPALLSQGEEQPSSGYLGPADLPPGCYHPLPVPPAYAETLVYQRDLRPVRALVARTARRAHLPAARITDLVLAVSELAANTLRHTRGGGTLHLWHNEHEMLCQIQDTGTIADPLAGYQPTASDVPGGMGLWLVNQVCDLVELRTSRAGTTICLHMRLN
jgi:anti-sigma regulatory factor (Ser/Thr protein kinase)